MGSPADPWGAVKRRMDGRNPRHSNREAIDEGAARETLPSGGKGGGGTWDVSNDGIEGSMEQNDR